MKRSRSWFDDVVCHYALIPQCFLEAEDSPLPPSLLLPRVSYILFWRPNKRRTRRANWTRTR